MAAPSAPRSTRADACGIACASSSPRVDCLLTPTAAVPPFAVEQNYPETVAGTVMRTYVDWFAPTFLLSLTGLPVASVPCGLDARGLPVGLQVVGRPNRGRDRAHRGGPDSATVPRRAAARDGCQCYLVNW